METFRKTSKWSKIKHFFTKWRIVDTDKYKIIPISKLIFTLTDKQLSKSNLIKAKDGAIEYTFYPKSELKFGVKVKVWKTGEYIDITDVD